MKSGSYASYRAAGAFGDERDDEPEPVPTRVECHCGKVLCDPPGATATEIVEDCTPECRTKRLAWEAQRQAETDAARADEWLQGREQ
jgi:hypothetical protein